MNPSKVIAFLDITGDWDPGLAVAMGAALTVTLIGHRLVLKSKMPIFEDRFRLPTRKDVDLPLISGAILFGIGWGLADLCPSPAFASASFAGQNDVIFLASMLIAIIAFRIVKSHRLNM